MEIKYTSKLFGCFFLCSFLIGCGGGGGSSTDQDNNQNTEPTLTYSVLNLLIPTASATEIPTGSTATVTITGQGINRSETLDNADLAAQFSDLLVGDYTVLVSVSNDGIEIGSYSSNVTLTSSGLSVSANITFNKASLVVEPIVESDYSNLNSTYDGEWKVTGSNSCINVPFNVSAADTTVDLTGTDISITIDAIFEPTIILTGTIDDTSGRLTASGTYQSSDFTTGTWDSNSISMPSDNSIFFSASLTNQTTGDCLIAIEYVGFK